MENLLTTQYQIMDEMNKLLTNFKKDGADRKTPDYIKRKLDILDSYWGEFNSLNEQLSKAEDRSHAYFIEGQYEKTKQFYLNTREYLVKYKSEISRPSTPIIKPPVLNLENVNLNPAGSSKAQGNPSKTDEMLRKQTSNFRAFYRTVSNINLDSTNEKWEFEDILKTMETRWSAIDTLHWEIDSVLNGEDAEYERTFNKYEKHYLDMKKAINTKMWSVSHKEKSTPQMEIPTFSGNYQTWTSFKDLFTETIHSNTCLSNAQKMQFLKSKIKGEAEKLIQHLSISSDNYLTCWEILNHRYNNKKLIFTSHINMLLNMPIMQNQSAVQIKRIHDTTNECLYAIKNLGVDTSTWDPLLVHILCQKLDAETHNDYIESLKNQRELPILSDFIQFLEGKFTSLESSRRKQDVIKSSHHHQEAASNSKKFHSYKAYSTKQYSTPKSGYNTTKAFNSAPIKCPLCQNEHGLFYCKAFLELQPDAKRKTVAKYNLCKNCLYNHNGKECISTKRCKHCNENHNSLLHDAFVNTMPKVPSSRNANSSDMRASTSNSSSHVSQEELSEILLATAQIKVQAADGSQIKMRALIDQGSQTSLITERAAQMLCLPRQRCKGVIFGVGAKENNCKGVINITCTARHSDYTFNTDVYIMRNLINNLPNRSFTKPSWNYMDSIDLADPEFNISRPVDLLLGADIYSTIILEGIIKPEKTQPIAQQTRLGWILCGNVQTFHCNVVLNNVEDIQRFWSVEDINDSSIITEEDQQCVQYYQDTTTRLDDGRYVVRLPLENNYKQKLGESKPMALAQFRQLERRFTRQENLATQYKLFMKEYYELNHMHDCTSNMTPSYYLPHHGVMRSDSNTSPLRVVFNASAKTTSSHSLNDLMKRGPNLQQDLMFLILKWRQYQFAFTADIEKMFRQIWVNSQDQHLQKIIWRDSPTAILREYQLATVTYGTKAAPFLAMMTLKRLATDEGHKYSTSQAGKVVQDALYMDDLLSGHHTLSLAKQLQGDLIQLLKSGGFNLRKWSSNKAELLKDVDTAQDKDKIFDFKYIESTKTLGLRWHPQSDQFTFQLKPMTTSNPTKRSLLSDISKLFDPLGWLSPISTKLKLLFKQVWMSNIQWDDQLPADIIKEWDKIKDDLQIIDQFHIQRWYHSHYNENIELHGFCDASLKAYACVIYSKIYRENEQISITLVAAKARLVPENKNLTLPRLELSGALLLSKLMSKVQQALCEHNIRVFGWTDSTATLGWIQGDANRWKPFVANRVKQIKETVPSDSWRYIKSSDNPADCASRGISAEQLKKHTLWWHGPDFLSTFRYQDEKEQPVYMTEQETKPSKQINVTTTTRRDNIVGDVINAHSNWPRATRVLAWILRAFAPGRCKQSYLTIIELRRARNRIIKYVQESEFTKDISNIKASKAVDSKSKLLTLNPYLDEDGLLRVGSRIKNANISQDMIHPLIIPHNSHLTDLLIDHFHKLTFHGGARLTLARLRQQYWIIGGIRAVKKRLHTCIKCRRHNPVKQQQIMGDLPAARVNPTRPFHHTGVDFTGYVDVKSSKGRGIKASKGYIAVFVCMVTKAVHLELVSDLSTSSFLAALRRMAARRGAPGHIYSDNGTNFVGANNILQKEFINLKTIINEELLSEINMMSIQWHFLAPSWPSAGGLWEAAVKSLKYHLKRVIGEQKLTFEEYSTLLAQLEACLNSRPLISLTEDPEDLDCLTPSHFLASGPILSIIETERDERTRWQLTQKIFNDIWKRWKTEYLTQLATRSKWQKQRPNIKIDDLVIIHDANLPAGKWALGRVIELHPGSDGLVRVVTVKTKNGHLKRPITKLSPILSSNETSQKPHQQEYNSATEATSSEQKPKRTTRNRKFNLYTMVLMLMSMFISTVNGAYNISNIKTNQTIYFDKISNMYLVRDDWNLIVFYNMEPYWQSTDLFNKYIDHLDNICLKIEKTMQCDVILMQLRHSYVELQYYNNMLLGQRFGAHARLRRGLVNGVGHLANYLFGVLDDDFAKKYQRDIQLVRKNQKHIAMLWKNQTSVIEAEYNLLKRVEINMDKQYKICNQHFNSLEVAANTLKTELQRETYISEFTISAIIANSLMTHLKNVQDSLLDTITDIYHGKFDIHLITPKQLREELSIISGQLSKELALPINNIQTDLTKIYHLLKVKARATKEYLIFEIKVPLVSRENYEIYKMITIPQQNGNNIINIIPVSEYLAINIQRDTYIPLSEVDIQNCIQYESDTQLCALQTPIFQMKSDESLCSRDLKSNQCAYTKTICENKWEQLSNINTYLFFCCGQCTLRFICGYQVTVEHVSKAGVISLGRDCVIKGETFTVFSHKQRYNELHTQADVIKVEIPPINDVINLSIPIIKFESEFKNDQAPLQEIDAQIQQMKTESPEIDRISYHDVHHYAAIYLLMGAAVAAGVSFAWWRVRRARRRAARPPARAPAPLPGTGVIETAFSRDIDQRASPNQSTGVVHSVNEQPTTSARFIDKATSPVFTKFEFTETGH